MATVAALVFAAGVLLAVRVMFFGVRRAVGEDFVFRASRLAAAAAIMVAGAMLYLWHRIAGDVTVLGVAVVVAASVLAGGGAWWLVRASAAVAQMAMSPRAIPAATKAFAAASAVMSTAMRALTNGMRAACVRKLRPKLPLPTRHASTGRATRA